MDDPVPDLPGGRDEADRPSAGLAAALPGDWAGAAGAVRSRTQLMRVGEVAEEFGWPSADVLEALDDLGEPTASLNSLLGPDTVERLRAYALGEQVEVSVSDEGLQSAPIPVPEFSGPATYVGSARPHEPAHGDQPGTVFVAKAAPSGGLDPRDIIRLWVALGAVAGSVVLMFLGYPFAVRWLAAAWAVAGVALWIAEAAAPDYAPRLRSRKKPWEAGYGRESLFAAGAKALCALVVIVSTCLVANYTVAHIRCGTGAIASRPDYCFTYESP